MQNRQMADGRVCEGQKQARPDRGHAMNAYTKLRMPPLQTKQPDPLPSYDAKDLTHRGVQANIVLNDQTYILRITRAGKLILTK